MPELPDVTVYVEALAERTVGERLERVRILNPFVLRSVDPPLAELEGARVVEVRRLNKRIIFVFEGDRYLVIHLMIAGRFRWLARGAKPPGKISLAALDFTSGTLVLTEAGSKRRASIHAVRGADRLRDFERGGLEVLDADLPAFRAALVRENRTLKRALTDPTILSGIGNAYSDEILHRARLSPFKITRTLPDDEMARLFDATRATLIDWTNRLRAESAGGFPGKVTAFREGMAVHGRYGKPCPVCDTAVQRIRHADNETNYCPRCQTEGRLLADRALSRLLKQDFPKRIEELE